MFSSDSEDYSISEAETLREKVKQFSDGELLSLYVMLEKLGVLEDSDALEHQRYRLAVTIYRNELMRRMRSD